MGFYINLKVKKGSAGQINKLWRKEFGESLIFTRHMIKKNIDFIQSDESQKHLHYIKTVSTWNKVFTICALDHGQVFLRPYGYSEERADEFEQNNKELKKQIALILDNRMLFEKVTGLSDAIEALAMNIKGDYIENGKLKYDETISFSKLPVKPRNLIYQKCLQLKDPELWKEYFKIIENGLTEENWLAIKNRVVDFSGFSSCSTIWQRCELIAKKRDNVDYGLRGRYQDGLIPNFYDLRKAIYMTKDDCLDLNKPEIITENNVVSIHG